MNTENAPFTVTRSQLPRYLARLGNLPQSTTIYKRFQAIDDSTPTWYVETEYPDIDRRYDLADQYGGYWYLYDTLLRVTDEDLEQADNWANR